MAKRILNRKDLRADYDAAERRKTDTEQDEGDEEVDTEEDEDEAAEAETEDEAGEAGEDGEEAKPAPKKRKAPAKPKAAKPRARSRSAKVTRMKVVWGVFNNSNQCVATFDFPRRKDAEDLVAKLTSEKKNTHFLQPVKEPLEEKVEK